jgi:ABC-2 type transport system permease protein
MSALALAFRQVRYENKAFWRNPPAAFFTFAFPLMFLFIFTVIFGNSEVTLLGRTTRASTFYVPAIAAFSVISACYTNVAMSVTFSRDEGILKRKRGTPLPGWSYLAGRVLHSCLVALLLVVIVSAAGVLFFGVDLPTQTMPAFVLTLIVGAAAFCSLGLALTAAIPNAHAAPAIVNGSILPLLFISDIFIPLEDAPGWLTTVADLFPIRHYAHAMLAAFNPFETGLGLKTTDLAIVALWGIAGLVLAISFFSWEPRK